MQELHADIQSQLLPDMLGTMLRTLSSHIDSITLEDVTQGLRACFKVLSKIQMPVSYMDMEAGSHLEEMELQIPEEESLKTEVRYLFTILTQIQSKAIFIYMHLEKVVKYMLDSNLSHFCTL